MEPERLFLMYAYPCIPIKLRQNKLTPQEASLIEEIIFKNHPIDLSLIPKFEKPYIFLNKQSEGKPWTEELVKNYWRNDHNKYVKDDCRVYESQILDLHGDNTATVLHEGNRGGVIEIVKLDIIKLFSDLQPAELITVHRKYAIEKI